MAPRVGPISESRSSSNTRARHGVEVPPDASSPGGLVLLTAEQVSQLAHDAAAAALAEFTAEQAPAPELVDGVAMAQLISVSRATLHRLRVAGMPCVPLGETFRYKPAAIIAWLEQGGGK